MEEGKYHEYKIPVEDPNVNDSFVIENVGAQFPRDMILDSKNKMIKYIISAIIMHKVKINFA